MKAIILTFSRVNNRGANLQCFALMSYLQSHGVEVEFLYVKSHKKGGGIKGKIYSAINDFYAERFRKQTGFRFTKAYASYGELCDNPPQADVFIVGSDQVWNVELTDDYDPRVFFFSFLPEKTKRVAYAASFGNDYWCPSQYDDEIRRSIKMFSAISVREDSAVDICRKEFGIDDAELVLDPTLLLDRQTVLSLTESAGKPQNDHIFCYLLYKDARVLSLVSRISKELDMPVRGLRDGGFRSKFAGLYGIGKWLQNIYNAKFVVTNSFHCMVFCILLHKPFAIVPPYRNRQTRMLSLLGKLNLTGRYIPDMEYLNANTEMLHADMDYPAVDELLDKERVKSKSFIDKNILA